MTQDTATRGHSMQRLKRKGARRRQLAGLIALPLLAWVLYLGVGNLLLNLRDTQAWLTEQAGLSIRWESGWSAYPGHLVLTALEIESDAPAFELAVDRARLRFSLPALLDRQLALSRVTLEGLRRFGLEDHRLEGDGEVSISGLRLGDDGQVAIKHLELTMPQAQVRRGNTLLADDIRLAAKLQLAPLRLREQPGLAVARFVSGTLSLDATANAWDVFTPYLRELGWLDLAGHGRLTGELTLEHGELVAGSTLQLDSPALRVIVDQRKLLSPVGKKDNRQAGSRLSRGSPERYRLRGGGQVIARVVNGEAGPFMALDVTLDEMLMQQPGRSAPLLTGRRFHLSARLAGADLIDRPRRLTSTRFEWEGARVPDVSALASYLPAGGALALHRGSARLEGYLAYRQGRVEGKLELVGEQVALTLAGRSVQGSMRLELALPEIDPSQRRLDLSGTHLEVSARGEQEALPLTTEFTLEQASLTSTVPLNELLGAQGPAPLNGRLVVQGSVARLDVLDDILNPAGDEDLTLEGGGKLVASLLLEQGQLAAGSRMVVTTESLRARLLDLDARGQGSVIASWQQGEERPGVRLDASLAQARVVRSSDGGLLIRDARLTLTAENDATALATPPAGLRLSLAWQDAIMPDVAVLQAYLPAAAPVRLQTGQATTQGRIEIAAGRAHGQVTLSGQHIGGQLLGREVTGELSLDLELREIDLGSGYLDLSGSRLTMQAATSASDHQLRTRIVAREARLGPLRIPTQEGPAPALEGKLVLAGLIANLGFLDDFLPEAHGLTLAGNGRFQADLRLANDQLLPGSQWRVQASDLAVGFLDYVAKGQGRLEAEIDGDDDSPGARVTLMLPRFSLQQVGEAQAHVSGRHFTLETQTTRFSLDPQARSLQDVTTHIQLPIAEVDDLSRYNAYLPDASGLALLGGRAGLNVDLRLEGLRAHGDLVLQAFDTAIRFGEQHLEGDLRLEARLRDGDLATRRFDASGSLLRLDNIQRHDDQTRGKPGWWARLDITEGHVNWTRPLQLDARLDLAMRDSGLLARLFLSRARQWEWLGQRLTVNHIRGNARLHLDDDSLQLREARLSGGPLEMRADLAIRDGMPDGSLYARLGILAVGISLEQGKAEVRLLRPRQWYERRRASAEKSGASPKEPTTLPEGPGISPKEPEAILEEVMPSQWQQILDTQALPSRGGD